MMGKPLENERVTARDFCEGDWRDLREIALSNAASEFASCDVQWPTDEKSAKDMCAYFASSSQFSAIYAKDVGKVVCFVNFNGVDDNKMLDVGHVMNLAYAGRGYEYEGLKMLCEYAFETMDIVGIKAYWAYDDKVKLEPLHRLGMELRETHENERFGDVVGTFVGCRLELTRERFAP